MSITNWVYIHGLFPLLDRQKNNKLGERMSRYQRRERQALAENQSLQWRELLALVQHAYETTGFYRQRFQEAGLEPRDIRTPQDFAQIPVLTRDDIRGHLSELTSSSYRQEQLLTSATGGTTDTPVSFLRDLRCLREKAAVQAQFDAWAGLRPGDKTFYLWGARSDYSQSPSGRWLMYERHIMRRVWAPTSLLNPEVLESYRQSLNRFRPKIVYTYPTPVALLCEYLQETGLACHHPSSVICTAELLLDSQRRLVTEVLQCPIFEHYGAREFGMIAAECESHNGLHLNPAAAYVEFVPVPGAEVEGLQEMLVTDLLNYGMPLIRYRINDCAVVSNDVCSCGRGYPLVRKITGRTTDVFYMPNGDVVPGVALTGRVLQVCPGVKKMQIIQETLEEFRIRFVPGAGMTAADVQLVRDNLRKFFPAGVRCQFEEVAEIAREASGKTRFCISRVRPQTHQAQRTAGSCVNPRV